MDSWCGLFIYLFLNKRQVVTLEKDAHACVHTRARAQTRGISFSLSSRAYGYHLLNFREAILLTFMKITLRP